MIVPQSPVAPPANPNATYPAAAAKNPFLIFELKWTQQQRH